MESAKSATKKRLIIFIVLAVAISWSIFLLIPILGLKYQGSGPTVAIVMAGMFGPSAANILTRLITKEGFKNMYLRPHFKGHIKQYLLIYFAPTALLFISAAVYFLIFPTHFDGALTMLNQSAAASGMAGLTAKNLLLITVLQIIIIGPVINIVPTMGEELGWRGYLLPKLRTLLSDRAAIILTGVIWGLWHTPVIVMGHNYGTGYAGYPWLGILMMVVFCAGVAGVIESYATIKMNSAIPAAMIHSVINAGGGLTILLVKGAYNPLLGPAITGLVGGLPFIIVSVILLIKIGNKMSLDKNQVQQTEL